MEVEEEEQEEQEEREERLASPIASDRVIMTNIALFSFRMLTCI